VKARGAVGEITAYGEVSPKLADPSDVPSAGPDLPGTAKSAGAPGAGSDGDGPPTLRKLDPILEDRPIGSTGNIEGEFHAGSIGKVVSYGSIDATITSGSGIQHVWALGDINVGGKQITTIKGGFTASAWGKIGGSLVSFASETISVQAYDELSVTVTTNGQVSLSSWESATSSIESAANGSVWDTWSSRAAHSNQLGSSAFRRKINSGHVCQGGVVP
jgi:hypothetical protein